MPARLFSLVIGLWLMFSPYLFNFGGTQARLSLLAGSTVAVVSVLAMPEKLRNLRYVNFAIAMLIIASCWLAAPWSFVANSAISGLLLAASSSYGGKGWGVFRHSQQEI